MKRVFTCGKCDTKGHTRASCPQLTDEERRSRLPQIRFCSKCGDDDHNIRRCPRVTWTDEQIEAYEAERVRRRAEEAKARQDEEAAARRAKALSPVGETGAAWQEQAELAAGEIVLAACALSRSMRGPDAAAAQVQVELIEGLARRAKECAVLLQTPSTLAN